MNPFDLKACLSNMTLIVDTREKPTKQAQRRIESTGLPFERKALPFGDYSVYCTLPNGEVYSLKDKAVIERKMSVDELCHCYCQDRARFEREFERAKDAGAKIYMLIEDATWEDIYGGKYRSKMRPESLVASILAWLSRYDCQLLFCKPSTTGQLIKDTLQRELKERLEAMPDADV